MPDPLATAFTEALAKPDGVIPASFAEDYAAELAAIANSAIRRAIAKVHAYWDDVGDTDRERRYGAARACDIITATLGLAPVKAGDVRHASHDNMAATVVGIDDDGFVAFTVDGCRYTLTLTAFMWNWSDRA